MAGKHIIEFSEMRYVEEPDKLPSVRELPCGWSDLDIKEKVVRFLCSKNLPYVICLRPGEKDAFTGEFAKCRGSVWQDETRPEFKWNDEIAYYVDMHDIALPDGFVSHVIQRYEEGFEPGELIRPWKE